jgi:trehalose 6-phosphate synthase
VAFHIRPHALNFLDTIATTLEARVDYGRLAVERGGRRTWIAHSPISSDADGIGSLADSADAKREEAELRQRLQLNGCKVGLGVDRIDYTKGIPERLAAVERFFEKYPQWIGHFCFIQIGVPSRIELKEYRNVQARMRRWVERINNRFPRPGGPTVHLVLDNLDFQSLVPYYRMADLCAVTALHDGMNLVAKEYVSACTDLDGALVLSPFTGAARELERAWLASPYDIESLADTLNAALSEAPEARQARMAALRETVQRHNIFDWTREVLDSVLSVGLRTPPAEEAPVAMAEPTAMTEPPLGTEGR